jgi:hypothetical protein
MTQPGSFVNAHQPDGPNWLQRRLRDIERTLELNASAKSLESSSIGSGGLNVTDSGAIVINPDGTGLTLSTVDDPFYGPSVQNGLIEFRSGSGFPSGRIRGFDDGASPITVLVESALGYSGQQAELAMNAGSAVLTVDGATDSCQIIADTDPASITVFDTKFTGSRASINGRGWTNDGGSGELRALTDAAAYVPLRASAFNVSSSVLFKRDVEPAGFDPVEVIKAAPAYSWRYRKEHAEDSAVHIGPMAEDLPAELVNDDGIDLRDLVGVLWEANRALIARVEALEAKLDVEHSA